MSHGGRAKTPRVCWMAVARAGGGGRGADPRHLRPGVEDGGIRLPAARDRRHPSRPEGPESRLPRREVREPGVLAHLSVPGRSGAGPAQSELLLGQRPDAPLRRAARRSPRHGATQVVNLGAGFDSRAYRFRERFPQARFFELDLPATIQAKQERVVKIFGTVPDRVVLVATDFTTRPLDAVLRDAGHDRTQRTFFIWEGVTPYLPEAANVSTLRAIRSGSASGSAVVYDYVLDAALRPDGGGLYGAKSTAAYLASVGEPLLTGWSQGQAAAIATREGFVIVSDVGPAELTSRYLTGSDGQPDGMMSEFARVIHVRVP